MAWTLVAVGLFTAGLGLIITALLWRVVSRSLELRRLWRRIEWDLESSGFKINGDGAVTTPKPDIDYSYDWDRLLTERPQEAKASSVPEFDIDDWERRLGGR